MKRTTVYTLTVLVLVAAVGGAMALRSDWRGARSDDASAPSTPTPDGNAEEVALPEPGAVELTELQPAGPATGAEAPDPVAAAERAKARAALIADLRSALDRGDAAAVREMAAKLRKALREDPELLAELGAIILDPGQSDLVRGTAAFILGSVDDPDAMRFLVEALTGTDPSAELATWLMQAIGAWKDRPEFDDRFGFAEGGPHVVEGPGGLRTPVRTHIRDEAAIDAVESYLLGSDDPKLRRTALETLRHSLGENRVRESFVSVLEGEQNEEVQAASAEALGHWTLEAGNDPAEVVAVRSRLVDHAVDSGNDLLRLRLESTLRAARLTGPEASRIGSLLGSESGASFDQQYFALEVAGSQAALLAADPQTREEGERLQRLLLETLAQSGEPKLRDKAAQQLGLVPTAASARALVTALEGDDVWHVRASAAQALASAKLTEVAETVDKALERAASSDPDERVRGRAAETLARRRR